MTRYVYDYQGMYGIPTAPEGLDPNYRGGYHGSRMTGGPMLAAYGDYREHHLDELGPAFGATQIPRPGQGSFPSSESASSM